MTKVALVAPIPVAKDEAQDIKKAHEWLFDHSLVQMTRIGRLLGITGVLFLFSAGLSTLVNLGAASQTELKFLFIETTLTVQWPVQILLFVVVVGAFAAMMYCFGIFASLLKTHEHLDKQGLARAHVLIASMDALKRDHYWIFIGVNICRITIQLLSLTVLLLSAGTLIYALL